jgi:hypothetical protein
LKDPILVELRNGRKMSGLVVWCQDNKVGVRFDNPLLDSDPLIFLS